MIIFGITGGSGSGKSSASAIFGGLGVQIIDTDVIAHEITQKGSKCLLELSKAFGDDIIKPDGTLDRKKLAHKAFSCDKNTVMLNGITHKYIQEKVAEEIKNSSAEFIGIDGAVIIGSIIEPLCDFIISVIADREVRAKRIKKRDSLTDNQVTERLNAQPDDDFYRQKSKYIIYNNGDMDELKKQVYMLYDEIKRL